MFRFTVLRHLSSLLSLLHLSLMSLPDRRYRIAINVCIWMYITRSQRTGKIHSTFVSRFVLGQVDVVVQNIKVDEIFISTRKEAFSRFGL